ncbi:hypothetical protein BBJ28_00026746, partial [Nothophytophthora sp. Chile5]
MSPSNNFDDDDADVVNAYDQHQASRKQDEEGQRKRAEVLATFTDVNVCNSSDRNDYETLDSDGPSDHGGDSESDDDGGTSFEDSNSAWTDEDIAAYMSEIGVDINDDDALLKLAKNRAEIKSWEETGW